MAMLLVIGVGLVALALASGPFASMAGAPRAAAWTYALGLLGALLVVLAVAELA